MYIIEQNTVPKSTTTPSEDAVVVTDYFAAVIDGATPKTSFRYPSGETPGQLAAKALSEAIRQLPPTASAAEATTLLAAALHQDNVLPCDRPIASCALFSATKHEVWMLGDCHFATLSADGTLAYHKNAKTIDTVLADWRRAVLTSLLSRGIIKPEQIQTDDPGRRIIQPHITRQVRFQNLDNGHRFAYCMLDGEPVPENFIRIFPIEAKCTQLILATDGYPEILPTLKASEDRLAELLAIDPLCIGPLMGTKGVRSGNQSFDDRTYLRIEL